MRCSTREGHSGCRKVRITEAVDNIKLEVCFFEAKLVAINLLWPSWMHILREQEDTRAE